MKFKAQAKQNQLLERISTRHLVVGIDIAQQSHVALSVNFRGILLGTPLHFSNDDAGFNQLLQWMNDPQETHQLNVTIIGMEPTGHYWLSLAAWLKDRSSKRTRKTATIRPPKATSKMPLLSPTWSKMATTPHQRNQ